MLGADGQSFQEDFERFFKLTLREGEMTNVDIKGHL